ncbi:hypothetical protein CYMTET_49333 [Cymbomonas tetramitiformis]|uniref:Uncharacterized protein n=1 Tax=Cymbomonas tetramitiformis TaxID=36881 RepID=A0AAE0BSD9_9CHLO|nr:hypothetical protein CYMTET_49333 [Cymbomonas tetramitiformis]
MLAVYWFQFIDARWDRHTVDRFATDGINKLLPRFNIRWWCLGTEALDCFSLNNWFEENNWWNPPFGLYIGGGALASMFWLNLKASPRDPPEQFLLSSLKQVKSASGALFTLHEMALVSPGEIPTKHPLAKRVRVNAKRRVGLKLKNQKPLSREVVFSGIPLYVPDTNSVPLIDLLTAAMLIARLSGVVNLFQGWDGRKARFSPAQATLNGMHMEYPQRR